MRLMVMKKKTGYNQLIKHQKFYLIQTGVAFYIIFGLEPRCAPPPIFL